RRATTAVLLRPAEARPARLAQRALPCETDVESLVLTPRPTSRAEGAELIDEVVGEPLTDLSPEGLVLGRETELHAGLFTIRLVPGRLHGEVAIVTGSTSGLGREIARVFAAEGAAIAVTGRDVDRGEAAATSIRDAGGDAAFFAADLTDEQQCGALVETVVDRSGRLTVL